MKTYLCILILIFQFVQAYCQERYSVLITEIMPDPAPQVALPSVEWIELKNVSSNAVDLGGWRLRDGSAQSGAMLPYNLLPDSFVIVCSGSAASAMSQFGNVITVSSFPSLDNDGEELSLISPSGNTIHSLHYNTDWYENAIKKEGGWTLEMKDSKRPCLANENWTASIHLQGGTPGKKNSVATLVSDDELPRFSHAYTTTGTDIVLVFNEPVDSLFAAQLSNFTIDHGRNIIQARALPPLFDKILITIDAPLENGLIYQVSIKNVRDCSGNEVSPGVFAKIALPAVARAGDLIINEILFNPRSNAYDFVEILNTSDSAIDASTVSIANRTTVGDVGSVRSIKTEPWYIFPGDHIVVTVDHESLALNYLVHQYSSVFEIESMPSFPDDEGTVILLNSVGEIIDEVHYYDDWHFDLVTDDEGISLERIDPNGPSNNSVNWHSAASTAGYGTPGYRNSQYSQSIAAVGEITTEPFIFSPDNDGLNDLLRITYKLPEQGNVANIIIYDASGRKVRQLVRNNLLSFEGYWNWDGLDDYGKKLPLGYYVLITEIFNLSGKKQRFKNVAALGRMLK